MATTHGNDGLVFIGANAVAEVTAFTYTETDTSIVEDTAMGDTAVTRQTGNVIDGSGSVTCHWDETDTNGQEAMTPGSTVTLNLYPEGNASTDVYYGGDVIIESAEVGVDMGSINSRTFNFVGPLTRQTVV